MKIPNDVVRVRKTPDRATPGPATRRRIPRFQLGDEQKSTARKNSTSLCLKLAVETARHATAFRLPGNRPDPLPFPDRRRLRRASSSNHDIQTRQYRALVRGERRNAANWAPAWPGFRSDTEDEVTGFVYSRITTNAASPGTTVGKAVWMDAVGAKSGLPDVRITAPRPRCRACPSFTSCALFGRGHDALYVPLGVAELPVGVPAGARRRVVYGDAHGGRSCRATASCSNRSGCCISTRQPCWYCPCAVGVTTAARRAHFAVIGQTCPTAASARDDAPRPMIDLTIGIPCFNEEATIAKVVEDFGAAFPQARLLVIDNASTDATAQVAREHGAEVIAEPLKGKGNAVQRLFHEAVSEYLIMVDGDDTYPAEEAHKLLAKLREEGGDTVVGCRVSPDGTAFKSTHQWANHLLSRMIYALFGVACGDLFSGYRLFTRRFYRNVPLIATGFEVEAELAMQTIDKRFVQRNVDVAYRNRPADSHSKLQTLPDGTRVVWTLLLIIKDCKPLPFFSLLSFLLLMLSLFAGAFPIYDYLAYRYVYRVPLAILAVGLALMASLSLCCGMLLETVVRHRKEEFFLRLRNLGAEASAGRAPNEDGREWSRSRPSSPVP